MIHDQRGERWACADIWELQLLAPATSWCSAQAPLACRVGDLSSKNYELSALNSVNFEYTDVDLPLKGSRSVIGRSLVIEDLAGNALSCANIVAVKNQATPSPTNPPTFPLGPGLALTSMPALQPSRTPSLATAAPLDVERLHLVFVGASSLQPSIQTKLVRMVGDSLGLPSYSAVRVATTAGDQLGTSRRRQLYDQTSLTAAVQPQGVSSDSKMTVAVDMPAVLVKKAGLVELTGRSMSIIDLDSAGLVLVKAKYAPADGSEAVYVDRRATEASCCGESLTLAHVCMLFVCMPHVVCRVLACFCMMHAAHCWRTLHVARQF